MLKAFSGRQDGIRTTIPPASRSKACIRAGLMSSAQTSGSTSGIQRKPVFLPNGSLPDNLYTDCLSVGGQVPVSLNCDRDAFFAVNETSPMATRSNLVNTIRISANMDPANGNPTTIDLLFYFVACLNFTSYSLISSPQSRPLTQVITPDLPMSESPSQSVPPGQSPFSQLRHSLGDRLLPSPEPSQRTLAYDRLNRPPPHHPNPQPS